MLLSATRARRLVAEAIGSAALLAIVVGSGVMGERLSGGNVAIALLANSIATGTGLVALILVFGPVSGAHFNPIVTLVAARLGGIPWRDVPGYVIAQFGGAIAGVMTAHAMFALPLLASSSHARDGGPQLVGEIVATAGLVGIVITSLRHRTAHAAFAVGCFITSAYWFTSSTSFANPAVTLARAATDTFTGIRFADVPGFVGAQLLGAVAATLLFTWLVPRVEAIPSKVDDA